MNSKKFKRNIVLKIMMALLPFGAAAQSIHIYPGAQLIENGRIYMALNNMSFINDGSFTAGNGSIVSFVGGATSSITNIGGSKSTPFSNLLVVKFAGDVMLNQDITVNAGLGLTLGNLLLNNHTITLGNMGIITRETEQARIMSTNGGKVVTTRAISANTPTNPGNIGAELLVNGVSGSQTTLTIERTFSPEILSNLNETITSINRGFTISSSTTNPINYRLRFFYFNNELNGNSADQLSLWSLDAGSGFFTELGQDSINLTNKSVIKNNLTQPGHFTLGNHATSVLIQPGDNITRTSRSGQTIASDQVQIYPNPSQDKFHVAITSSREKDAVIRLVDQTGHVLQQKTILCHEGMNLITWDMSNYASGVYYIIFKNIESKNIKIIKE
jgi:Secretion system C-terminal sorting domain